LIFGIDPILFIGIAVISEMFFLFIFIMALDIKDAKKSVFLYYNSNKQAQLKNAEVKDGLAKIGKKSFQVDDAFPTTIMQGMFFRSRRPFHVVKHDVVIEQEFHDDGIHPVTTPDNLPKLLENATLKQFLSPPTSMGMAIAFMIIGLVIGGLGGYAIINSGVLG